MDAGILTTLVSFNYTPVQVLTQLKKRKEVDHDGVDDFHFHFHSHFIPPSLTQSHIYFPLFLSFSLNLCLVFPTHVFFSPPVFYLPSPLSIHLVS